MAYDTPSFAHLNRAQKRALVIRDELKQLDPRNLDKHIEGVTEDEPPTYRKIDHKIVPALTQVSLKESGSSYDLGNVTFPEENAIHRVHLVVEKGQYQMRTSERIPHDDAELFSIPIHSFVAKNILPLFQERWEALHTRKNKINEARHAAYSMANQPKARFTEGKTIARLDPSKAERNGATQAANTRKRMKGDPVVQHPSNKRQRIGLDTIPDMVKSETFNTIPSQVKIDLFNTIVKTAFPNFDNLIMASWNVVSIYLNVGSEFPELHKAIVDLNSVLKEFESTYGKCRMKKEPQEQNIQQTPSGVSGTRSGKPAPEEPRQTGSETVTNARGRRTQHPPSEEDTTESSSGAIDETGDEQQGVTPPRILQMARRGEDEEQDRGRARFEHTGYERMRDMGQSDVRNSQENQISTNPLYEQQLDGTSSRDRLSKYPDQYTSSSNKTARTGTTDHRVSHDGPREKPQNNLDDLFEEDEEDNDYEAAMRKELSKPDAERQAPFPREPAPRQPAPRERSSIFLGKSMLGRPKQLLNPTGSAPMAPMVHNQRDSNPTDLRRKH